MISRIFYSLCRVDCSDYQQRCICGCDRGAGCWTVVHEAVSAISSPSNQDTALFMTSRGLGKSCTVRYPYLGTLEIINADNTELFNLIQHL